jgi:hypothetical protein
MSKNTPVKGEHGIGARGDGKLLYFHTNIAQTIRHTKDKLLRKTRKPVEYRQPNGHWVHI